MSLNVENSLSEFKWNFKDVNTEATQEIIRAHGVPEIIARLLVSKGISSSDVDGFLNPTLMRDFPDPFKLKDMEECASFTAKSIMDGRNIAIFGDFDVDGATSTSLVCRFLRSIGVDAPIYIPDRLREGYGPNADALKKLREDGGDVVILTDCGTTSFEVMTAGKECGLDLIILDHHEQGERLPDADFIINPKRHDDTSDLDMLAAVGVALLFCVAVNKKLKEVGFYDDGTHKPPAIKDLLDIVALGTICDMVPLTGANRLFVKRGFERMAKTENAGLLALMESSNIKETPTPYHAGFMLGPRINAGGRIHKSDLGARLLATDDVDEAKTLAFALHDCNVKRRAMQLSMEKEAVKKVKEAGIENDSIIVIGDESWHPGLAGLVAGRLKDKYKKPACVVAFTENDKSVLEGRGSGRSIKGIHIASAFMDAHEAGILIKGGGHAMAGGFTVAKDKVNELREFLCEHVSNQSKDIQTEPECLEISGVLTASGMNADLVTLIQHNVGPFGQGAPEPIFALSSVRIWSADIVGSSHVRVMLSDAEGGARIKAIAFRAKDKPLGQALLTAGNRIMHIAGTLSRNEWQGRVSAEMHIQDGVFV